MELELGIRAAGPVQLAIAAANFVAVRMFRYQESLAGVPETVRQVFWVQNVFIVVVLIGSSLLCLSFPGELAGGSSMGRAISGFLAVFWGLRLGVQLLYYSPAKRREHRILDALFIVAFAALCAVFAIGAFAMLPWT